MTVSERFWSKVAIAGEDECWPWQGSLDHRGYGRFQMGGKSCKAHRVALMLRGGIEPFDGASALHACDNPSCVNPAHLRWGTQADNMNDRSKRERSGLAKLTAADVRAIRASKRTQYQLADDFGVTQTNIHKVLVRKTWRHI